MLGTAAQIDSSVHGVHIGLHTYSFSESPREGILDVIIGCMADAGIGECILLAQQIEPGDLWGRIRSARGTGAHGVADVQALARGDLAKWRMSVSLDYFREIRRKFENEGIRIHGFGASLNSDATTEELHRIFEMAAALGAGIITLAGTNSLAKRLAPIVGAHRMMIGLQGRPSVNSTDPDQLSKPEDYERVLSLSENLRLSFDIGDATGAGYDVLRFLRDHRARIDSVYLKDRRKDGVSMPWGEGDTPIREVLQWISNGKYPIRAFIDCDYKSAGNRAADVKRCFEYAKAALA